MVFDDKALVQQRQDKHDAPQTPDPPQTSRADLLGMQQLLRRQCARLRQRLRTQPPPGRALRRGLAGVGARGGRKSGQPHGFNRHRKANFINRQHHFFRLSSFNLAALNSASVSEPLSCISTSRLSGSAGLELETDLVERASNLSTSRSISANS